MITIKNESQIEKMRNAGVLLHSVLETLRKEIQPALPPCTWIKWLKS